MLSDTLTEFRNCARAEADAVIQNGRAKLPEGATYSAPFDVAFLDPGTLVSWAESIAEALVYLGGLAGGVHAGRTLWKKVRSFFDETSPSWTVEEYIVYSLIKNEGSGYASGLSVRQLMGRFSRREIQAGLRKLRKLGLAKHCYSRRTSKCLETDGRWVSRTENVWFPTGIRSHYSSAPTSVYFMYMNASPQLDCVPSHEDDPRSAVVAIDRDFHTLRALFKKEFASDSHVFEPNARGQVFAELVDSHAMAIQRVFLKTLVINRMMWSEVSERHMQLVSALREMPVPSGADDSIVEMYWEAQKDYRANAVVLFFDTLTQGAISNCMDPLPAAMITRVRWFLFCSQAIAARELALEDLYSRLVTVIAQEEGGLPECLTTKPLSD